MNSHPVLTFKIILGGLLLAASAATYAVPAAPRQNMPAEELCIRKSNVIFSCNTADGTYSICKSSPGVRAPLTAYLIKSIKPARTGKAQPELIKSDTITYSAESEGAKATSAVVQFETNHQQVRIDYELSATEESSGAITLSRAPNSAGKAKKLPCLTEPTINDYVLLLNYEVKN